MRTGRVRCTRRCSFRPHNRRPWLCHPPHRRQAGKGSNLQLRCLGKHPSVRRPSRQQPLPVRLRIQGCGHRLHKVWSSLLQPAHRTIHTIGSLRPRPASQLRRKQSNHHTDTSGLYYVDASGIACFIACLAAGPGRDNDTGINFGISAEQGHESKQALA